MLEKNMDVVEGDNQKKLKEILLNLRIQEKLKLFIYEVEFGEDSLEVLVHRYAEEILSCTCW
jgi:hypothetical protein